MNRNSELKKITLSTILSIFVLFGILNFTKISKIAKIQLVRFNDEIKMKTAKITVLCPEWPFEVTKINREIFIIENQLIFKS